MIFAALTVVPVSMTAVTPGDPSSHASLPQGLLEAVREALGTQTAEALASPAPPTIQQAKLIAADAQAAKSFGTSVALDGDTAVVGAPDLGSSPLFVAGSAYVFVRSGTTWSQEARLNADFEEVGDQFGLSVAISGDTVVVGSLGGGPSFLAGSAYVFVRSGTAWSQEAKLNAADAEADDYFGWSVALAGDTAVIGAFQKDAVLGGGPIERAGSAYVFTRSGTVWSQEAKLNAADAETSDNFGWSVALAGDTVLVGAPWEDPDLGGGPLNGAGSSYIFTRSGTSWSQEAKLNAADAEVGDRFGQSVALAGDTAVIGADFEDPDLGSGPVADAGSSYVFVRSGATWNQQAKLAAADAEAYDNFGSSVALAGDTVIVGATLEDPDRGGAESLVTVDSGGDVGTYTSLALDSSGNPVVSYYDFTNGDLKLVHCNDPNCAGGDESLVTVDSAGQFGRDTSLALDGSGFPVVSYYDATNGDLKLVHCNDPNCAGGDESIVAVDSDGSIGQYSSLAPDSSGLPVVSYFDGSNGDLKLAHCNDPNCAGGDESLVTVDTAGIVGPYTSLALDGSGFPVISYWWDVTNDLKLVHCNDANCAGGDESIVTVDSGFVGEYSSLALDGSGFPVVSYYDATNDDLKLVHCNDANCAGGDESIVTVDSDGSVGQFTSLALDGSGFPVVSYYDATNGFLKLAHCDDANCDGHSLVTVDSVGQFGGYTSLVLDGSGFPVVSYYDSTNDDLKLAHCNDPNCAGGPDFNAGSAYVFVRSGTTWSQEAKLVAADAEELDNFGSSVALSGDTVVVGANHEDPDLGGPPIFDAGSAYVFVAPAPTQTFPDVPPDHWAWQFVEAIFSAGLTAGFPDGTYRPDNPVTRAEMSVFLKKGIHGSTYTPPAPDGSHPFSDIFGHWAEAWMEELYDEGLTSGYPDNTYRPENRVSRAEMAVFLLKAMHGSAYTPPAPAGGSFSDVAGHWAEAWIEQLKAEGITSGYPDGTYRPENQVTRAEMAVFLVNAFSLPLP